MVCFTHTCQETLKSRQSLATPQPLDRPAHTGCLFTYVPRAGWAIAAFRVRVIRCVCGQGCGLPLCCLPSRLRLLCSPALPSRSLEPAEDPVQTQLHRLPNPSFYGYQDTPWQIFLRKEVPGRGRG